MPTLQDALNAKPPPLTSAKELFERIAFNEPVLSLKKAILYALDATSDVDATDPPPTPMPLDVEGPMGVRDGVTFTNTDNPQLTFTTKLIKVHAEWAHGMVPQELVRVSKGWRFANGDLELSVANGEAEATARPIRAGSLSEGAYAWPDTERAFSGETGDEVRLLSRIRVGYLPVDVKLLVRGPKGFASNTDTVVRARIALDPSILLVPVEVARFFSDRIPVSRASMAKQMALWDQTPIMNATTNFRSTDGGTGELRTAERAWDAWPTPDDQGLYQQEIWISPDSIWSKAGVRFRLVNHIDIKTDDIHVNPQSDGGDDSNRLTENFRTLSEHPQHITDQRVVSVIFMHRVAPPGSPVAGQSSALRGMAGISAETGGFATIAHEIGHLMGLEHHPDPNNVMAERDPGTEITDLQKAAARAWAMHFAEFWQH